MDYFHYGLTLFQIITLIGFGILLYKLSKQKKSLQLENLRSKREISRSLEESTSEVFDKIEELKYELSDVHYQLIDFLQKQVSWRTVKKELPPPLQIVLLLKEKTKSEHTGFLSKNGEFWTLHSLGGGPTKVSLEEISQWKPLVQK